MSKVFNYHVEISVRISVETDISNFMSVGTCTLHIGLQNVHKSCYCVISRESPD